MSKLISILQKVFKLELVALIATAALILVLSHLHGSSHRAGGSGQMEAPLVASGGVIGGSEPSPDHCGCESTCEKCHHLCLECKCGSHIIDRGIKCQEFAGCEAGCSGIELGSEQTEQSAPPDQDPGGPKPCKHCHKVCDDAHGGDANPECQACLLEHCVLGEVGSTGDGFATCTDIDDLGARLNELGCGQDAVTQKALKDLAIDAGCQR